MARRRRRGHIEIRHHTSFRFLIEGGGVAATGQPCDHISPYLSVSSSRSVWSKYHEARLRGATQYGVAFFGITCLRRATARSTCKAYPVLQRCRAESNGVRSSSRKWMPFSVQNTRLQYAKGASPPTCNHVFLRISLGNKDEDDGLEESGRRTAKQEGKRHPQGQLEVPAHLRSPEASQPTDNPCQNTSQGDGEREIESERGQVMERK